MNKLIFNKPHIWFGANRWWCTNGPLLIVGPTPRQVYNDLLRCIARAKELECGK